MSHDTRLASVGALLVCATLLSACGGTGSGAGTTVPPTTNDTSATAIARSYAGQPLQDARCRPTSTPVALAAGQPQNQAVFGILCTPSGGASHTVHLLLHGGTYSHLYWMWPYQPQRYSYVEHLLDAGYSTFAIDRVGDGFSSHPPSSALSLITAGYVAHQLVGDLRNGGLGRFTHVVLAGHSLGSYASWSEAGTYGDIDGVIITGATHETNPAGNALALQDTYPSSDDPQLAWMHLDSGYLTTKPGTRGAIFYNTAITDPVVLALDELTKQTLTGTELSSLQTTDWASLSRAIHVPVLVIIGQDDLLSGCGPSAGFCSSTAILQQQETPYYAPQAHAQFDVLPTAGHDINLEPNASTWYDLARTWSDQNFGP